MALDLPETDVLQFCEVAHLDIDRDGAMVRTALRSNRTMEQLVMDYFDDAQAFRKKYQWDETAFAAGRDGEMDTRANSLNGELSDSAIIQGVSPGPHESHSTIGAPSRPPSRLEGWSQGGTVLDWDAPNGPGMGGPPLTTDDDLQRALAESARESGIEPQEVGVTDSSLTAPYFGPANRDDYDLSSWAMVTTAQTATQLEPSPSSRKRAPDAPAFLIHQSEDAGPHHRIGAILTILHEIPLARNVLLQTGSPADSYGLNTEWWKGQPILRPDVLAALQGPSPEAVDAKPNFNEELHRLMAFLDSTERGYGSVGALGTLLTPTSSSMERQFFDVLSENNDVDVLKPLLHEALSLVTNTFEVVDKVDSFSFLDFELNPSQWSQIQTFTQVWDWLAWDEAMAWQEVTADTKMTVLRDMGEVLTVMLDGECPESIEIPEVWYPERYLEARKEEARIMQEHLAWTLQRLYSATGMEHQLKTWESPTTHKSHDRREILAAIVDKYGRWLKYLEGLADGDSASLPSSLPEQLQEAVAELGLSPLTESLQVGMQPALEQLLRMAEQQLADFDQRMERLNTQREKLEEYRRFLGTLLTDPSVSEGSFVGKRFLLRGIATAADVVYVCRRAERQLIELEDPEPLDQWWRLAYTTGTEAAAKAEKLSREAMMELVFKETRKPLLVYATEDALSVPRLPLTDALHRFVRADNKTFRQEVNRENDEEEARKAQASSIPNPVMSPISPSKRKYRSNSIDSMATNRASLGNSDTDSRAGDFADEDTGQKFGGEGRFTTEMPTMPARPSPPDVPGYQMEASAAVPGTEQRHQPWAHAAPRVQEETWTEPASKPDGKAKDKGVEPEMQQKGGNGSLFGSRHLTSSTGPESMDMDTVLD